MHCFGKVCLWGMLLVGSLQAQMQNHYVLGTHGLNSAVTVPYGFTFNSIYTYYHANSLRDRNGHKVHFVSGPSHLNMQYLQNYFAWYSCCPLLGGYYGCRVNVPFETTSTDSTYFDSSFRVGNRMRFSDLYVEPINVRWQWGQWYVFAAYGLYLPTGSHRNFSLHNHGLGNWGNLLTLAGTYFFDCAKTFSASAYTTYEMHFKTRGINFYAGDNLCVDWGIGKTFAKYFSLGVVGYFELQVTKDRGKAVPFNSRNLYDHVLAIGGEFDIVIPQLNGIFTVRYEQEFNAVGRTEGESFIVRAGFTY